MSDARKNKIKESMKPLKAKHAPKARKDRASDEKKFETADARVRPSAVHEG